MLCLDCVTVSGIVTVGWSWRAWIGPAWLKCLARGGVFLEETRKAEAGFSVLSACGYVGDRLFALGMDGMKPLPLRVPLALCLS